MTDNKYSTEVLDHLGKLLSLEPFEDYYNMACPEAGRDTLALINADTGQTFIISVRPGKIINA
jgi:hypothetical protein